MDDEFANNSAADTAVVPNQQKVMASVFFPFKYKCEQSSAQTPQIRNI